MTAGAFRHTTDIIHAARTGDVAGVMFFLATAKDPSILFGPAARICAEHGQVECLREVLTHCEPDGYDAFNALCKAAERGQVECVRVLLDHGVDPARVNSAPLQEALNNRHPECIAQLAPVSDLADVVLIFIDQKRDRLDQLAEYLPLPLLQRASVELPEHDLPRIRTRLSALVLEGGTPIAPAASLVQRL